MTTVFTRHLFLVTAHSPALRFVLIDVAEMERQKDSWETDWMVFQSRQWFFLFLASQQCRLSIASSVCHELLGYVFMNGACLLSLYLYSTTQTQEHIIAALQQPPRHTHTWKTLGHDDWQKQGGQVTGHRGSVWLFFFNTRQGAWLFEGNVSRKNTYLSQQSLWEGRAASSTDCDAHPALGWPDTALPDNMLTDNPRV